MLVAFPELFLSTLRIASIYNRLSAAQKAAAPLISAVRTSSYVAEQIETPLRAQKWHKENAAAVEEVRAQRAKGNKGYTLADYNSDRQRAPLPPETPISEIHSQIQPGILPWAGGSGRSRKKTRRRVDGRRRQPKAPNRRRP